MIWHCNSFYSTYVFVFLHLKNARYLIQVIRICFFLFISFIQCLENLPFYSSYGLALNATTDCLYLPLSWYLMFTLTASTLCIYSLLLPHYKAVCLLVCSYTASTLSLCTSFYINVFWYDLHQKPIGLFHVINGNHSNIRYAAIC